MIIGFFPKKKLRDLRFYVLKKIVIFFIISLFS